MRENTRQEIQMSVKELREGRGWSQEHLAQASGVSYRTIQRVEAGRRASFETLRALAAVFETDINRIRQEPKMQTTKTTPTPETNEMAEEYVLNIKAMKINFFTYIIVMPLMYILNEFISPGFMWSFILFLAWGVSFLLHAIAIRILFGTFDLSMKEADYVRFLQKAG